MGFDGADGAVAASDEGPLQRGAATTFAGNAQLDTAQFKYGTASLLLDGTGDRVDWADSDDWSFGSGDFTIEAWIRFADLTGFQTIVSQWDSGVSNDRSWMFDYTGSANNTLRFGYSTNGTAETFVQGAWSPSADTWYHVAVDRSGATLRLYANGAVVASQNIGADAFSNEPEGIRIGAVWTGSNTNFFNGWIDELRITKGVGRYGGAYVVPSQPFPRG